jgi:TetR/AcrR family transcriptional repressor of bet genes
MSKAATSSSPAMSGATTRDRLIDAAFRVVARDGLEAASVKIVATEAGITPGLVHYHFPNKDKMIEAALRRGLDEYLARSQARRAATPPHKQIEAFFANARATFAPDRDFFKVRLALAARAMTQPDLAAVMTEINAAAVDEVAQVFASASDRTVPSDRDIALAATLKAAFDGIMLAWINDAAFPIESAGEILEQAAINWVEQPRLL